jgi:hypothetical protein
LRAAGGALASLAFVVVIGVLSHAGAAALGQPSGEAQVSQVGQVTVTVSWVGTGDDPSFWIVLDTHSVNLDLYDLSQLARLRIAQTIEVAPTNWEAPAGGHHREGLLRFPASTAEAGPIFDAETGSIALVIREVGGVSERTFVWTW